MMIRPQYAPRSIPTTLDYFEEMFPAASPSPFCQQQERQETGTARPTPQDEDDAETITLLSIPSYSEFDYRSPEDEEGEQEEVVCCRLVDDTKSWLENGSSHGSNSAREDKPTISVTPAYSPDRSSYAHIFGGEEQTIHGVAGAATALARPPPQNSPNDSGRDDWTTLKDLALGSVAGLPPASPIAPIQRRGSSEDSQASTSFDYFVQSYLTSAYLTDFGGGSRSTTPPPFEPPELEPDYYYEEEEIEEDEDQSYDDVPPWIRRITLLPFCRQKRVCRLLQQPQSLMDPSFEYDDDDDDDEDQQEQMMLRELEHQELFEGLTLLRLAAWKHACLRSLPSFNAMPTHPNHIPEFILWGDWCREGWAVEKESMRKDPSVDAIMLHVAMFLPIPLNYPDDSLWEEEEDESSLSYEEMDKENIFHNEVDESSDEEY